jgi:hypothetical protein
LHFLFKVKRIIEVSEFKVSFSPELMKRNKNDFETPPTLNSIDPYPS